MSEKSPYLRRAEELSARGLCVNCGFRPSAPGIRMCRVCSMRCHESYERRKERLGIHQGKQGSHPKYTYIIYDPNGRDEIFRGTAIECAKRFYVIDWTIHKAGKVGRRLLGIYPIVRIPWEGVNV